MYNKYIYRITNKEEIIMGCNSAKHNCRNERMGLKITNFKKKRKIEQRNP